MEIPRSQYLAATDVFDLPCFSFSGERVSRQDAGPFDGDAFARSVLQVAARPFAGAIIQLAASVSFDEQNPDPIVVPLTIFGFDTSPAIFTIPAAGKVKVNLGVYMAIRSVPFTVAWLQSLYSGAKGLVTFDSIDSVQIPKEAVDELEAILRWWLRLQEEGKFDFAEVIDILTPSMTSPQAESSYETIGQMFDFISFHEFAHWFASITPPLELEQVLERMRSYLRAWPEEDDLTNPNIRQDVARLFADNPRVLENWVQELHADALAVQFCLQYFPHYYQLQGQQLPMRVFAAQALVYYLLLFLNEVFYEDVLKKPLDWRTHPPAGLRVKIFCYVGSRIQGRPLAEFTTEIWGVGTFIGFVTERLISALRLRVAAW